MNFYIAGPITGDPDYKRKFDAAASSFSQDWPNGRVMNPATLPEGMNKADYMSICLPMLLRARVVIMLPGWEQSGGAKIEKALADYVGIQVVELDQSCIDELLSDGVDPSYGSGRLIDADAFLRAVCNRCDGECEVVDCDCVNCVRDCRCEFAQILAEMPAVDLPGRKESR